MGCRENIDAYAEPNKGAIISKGAIICAGVKILSGNEPLIVGQNTIIGANAVLLDSTGENEIWGVFQQENLGCVKTQIQIK